MTASRTGLGEDRKTGREACDATAAAAVRALAALLYRRASGLTLAGITVLGQILSYDGPPY